MTLREKKPILLSAIWVMGTFFHIYIGSLVNQQQGLLQLDHWYLLNNTHIIIGYIPHTHVAEEQKNML